MEPWDGPRRHRRDADGRYACCTLDRNGLRPARWVITKNRHITVASEAGVWDYNPEDVVRKGNSGPGKFSRWILQTAELLDTKQVDDLLKSRHPYKVWLKKGVRYLQTDLIDPRLAAEPFDRDTLALFQKMYNVSAEERDESFACCRRMRAKPSDPWADTRPCPCCRRKVRSLVRLLSGNKFAQVTNPPSTACAKASVMALQTANAGPEANIFVPRNSMPEQSGLKFAHFCRSVNAADHGARGFGYRMNPLSTCSRRCGP